MTSAGYVAPMRLAERTTNLLFNLLHDKGISHADAALATGRTKSYIQRRLSGAVEPNITDLEQLAQCAGLEVRIEFVPRDA